MSDETRGEVRARLSSPPGSWGQYGSSLDHVRYMKPVLSTSRRRCHCGCGKRATYVGMANGVALTSGCEWSMRRWVRGNG